MNRLTAWALARPLGAAALCLCLVGLGLLAAGQLKLRLYTDESFPALTVTCLLSDVGPLEMENLVTRPLEQELRQVTGCRKVTCVSSTGRCVITLQLNDQADLAAAANDLRGRLKRIRPKLPADLRQPVVSQYNPADRPLAVLAVGGEASLEQAGVWARQRLMPRLRRVPGVSEVQLSGAPEPEVQVICDPGRLKALGLTARRVAQAINRQSSALPAGSLTSPSLKVPIKTAGRVTEASELADLPVAADSSGRLVTVGQLARVEPTFRQPNETVRLNGRPVASLALFAAAGSDPVRLWRQVRDALDETAAEHGLRVDVVFSQAQLLDQATGRLGWMALVAAAAAAAALFLFLRSLLSTAIALCAIPFSLLLAVLLLWMLDLRLDLITLSGLALALGILVDNAVVVVESVHHRWAAGDEGKEGIASGVAEVAGAIAFSTLTTVGAFLPLVLISSRVRANLAGFFWGLSLTLCASLAAALVLTPLLLWFTRRWRRGRPWEMTPPPAYRRLLSWATGRPALAALAACLPVAAAGLLWGQMIFGQGAGLNAPGWRVLAVMPPGTATENTDRQVRSLEEKIRGVAGVERVLSRAWGNQGRLTVTLAEDRAVRPAVVEARLRELLPADGPARFHLVPMSPGQGGATLGVRLLGPDLAGLAPFEHVLIPALRQLPEVRDLVVHKGGDAPVMNLPLDHAVLARYGLTAAGVAAEVRGHLIGPVAVRLPGVDEEVEVRVKAVAGPEEGLVALEGVYLSAPDGALVPLGQAARPEMTSEPAELFRENLRRVVNLNLVLVGDDVLGAAEAVRAALDRVTAPPGYAWLLGEEVEGITRTRGEMLSAAAAALALVYLIMVAATESLAGPLVILATAPPAAAGVLLALRLAGLPVDLPVYLGGILLSGLVVNVGIVMFYAMDRLRRDGLAPAEAARQGALRRLRPVLTTTLSTAAAALPLLIDSGAGSGAWAPLALTLASGVVASALISLVLTPALYALAFGRRGPNRPRP